MKPIRQHLAELPQPYNLEALDNMVKKQGNVRVKHNFNALQVAFNWRHTTEGQDYWETLYNKLLAEHNDRLDVVQAKADEFMSCLNLESTVVQSKDGPICLNALFVEFYKHCIL